MARVYTVDASVLMNAFNRHEAGYEQSRRCMERLGDEASPWLAPALCLPELAAAIARGRDDSALAMAFASAARRLPSLSLIPIDISLAEEAMRIAAERRLRGSDAVYAAVALRFSAVLITLDREQLQRLRPTITVRTPAEVVAQPEL